MAKPPELVRLVSVVAVSPSDVMVERGLLERVVDELNRTTAPSHGCRLSLWRWETDSHPGLHLRGPQGLIDDAMRIENADVVVGIFWTRFGTPVLDAESGTEHELRRAWSAWREQGHPQVMVYFCERKSRPTDAAEADQLQQLLRFREAMPKELLWWPYAKPTDFERAVREHLTAFLLDLGRTRAPQSGTHSTAAVNVAVERLDPASGRPRADVIAAAGTRLPFTSSWEYTTQVPNQATVPVKLLQRPGGLDASSDPYLYDPLPHATLRLRPGLANGSPLQITTTIDAAGRLTLRATYPQDGSGKGLAQGSAIGRSDAPADGADVRIAIRSIETELCPQPDTGPAPPQPSAARPSLPRRVFVSYAQADRDVAGEVAKTLRASGVDAWIDAYVPPGKSWSEAVRKQIDQADAFVLLISKHQSERSRFELTDVLKHAWADNSKRVLPVMLGDAESPGFLRDQRAVRLDPQSWSGVEEIVRYLVDQPDIIRPPAGQRRLLRRLSVLESTAASMVDSADER